MKKCPNCNRTYADESLNFCLDDGTVLISAADNVTDENIQRQTEQQTEILSQDKVTEAVSVNKNTDEHSFENETVFASQNASNESQPQIIKQGVSPMFAYLSVGLLALLVLLTGIGIAFWINSNSTTNSNAELSQSNSNSNDSEINDNKSEGTEDEVAIDLANKSTPKKTPVEEKKSTPKKDDKDDKEKDAKPTPTKSSTPTPTPEPTNTPEAEKGRYFIILGSFPQADRLKAKKRLQLARSKGLPARIVNTNNVAGLRNGLLAVVMGPYSKSSAQNALRRARTVSSDAYVKAG